MTYKVFQIDVYNTLVGIVYFKNEKKDIDDIINTFNLPQNTVSKICKILDSSDAFVIYPVEIKSTKEFEHSPNKSYYKDVILIFFQNDEDLFLTHGTIAHEINHVADYICDNNSIIDTEAKSYLIGYITNHVYTFIKDNKVTLHYINDLKIDFEIDIEKPFLHM